MLNVQIISGRNASLNFYIRHPLSSVLLLFFTHSQGPASRVTHFLHPPALQREREHQQFRGSGDDGWWRWGQAEEEQEEEEEEQHDLHHRGARKDEHAGLQAGEDGLFFPHWPVRRSGDLKSRKEASEEDEQGGDAAVAWSLSPPSCQRSRSSAVTPTCLSPTWKACHWPAPTLDPCQPSQVTRTHKKT